MELLKDKTDKELLQSIIAEAAKSTNELKCSAQDIQKAQNRLSFLLLTINELLNRSEKD